MKLQPLLLCTCNFNVNSDVLTNTLLSKKKGNVEYKKRRIKPWGMLLEINHTH